MNVIHFVYYLAMIFPIAWLVWLASRPFVVNLSRLLLIVFGMVLYGYLVTSIVIPLTRVITAYIKAKGDMAKLEKLPFSPDVFPWDEGTISFLVYIGVVLAVFFLLMLWLQRVLARCPLRTPD